METKTDKQAFLKVLMEGYKNAAQAFSSFTGQQIKLDEYQYAPILSGSDLLPFWKYASNDSFVLLTTHLKGDLEGVSYLIFSQTEIYQFFKTLALGGMTVPHDLESAMLLETDNILAASVVSAISNAYNIKLFGDVPTYERITAVDLMELVSKHCNEYKGETAIIMNQGFSINGQKPVQPKFIWFIKAKKLS
jgi:chemotaxis protein CheY-P-specific phosphatase CheC